MALPAWSASRRNRAEYTSVMSGNRTPKSLVVEADERIAADEVDVVVDDHQRTLQEAGVHTTGRVGQDQGLHAEQAEHADREGDGAEVVALVGVTPTRQRRQWCVRPPSPPFRPRASLHGR